MSKELSKEQKKIIEESLSPEEIDFEPDDLGVEFLMMDSVYENYREIFDRKVPLESLVNYVQEISKNYGYPQVIIDYLLSSLTELHNYLEVSTEVDQTIVQTMNDLVIRIFNVHQDKIEKKIITKADLIDMIYFGLMDTGLGSESDFARERIIEILQEAGLLE